MKQRILSALLALAMLLTLLPVSALAVEAETGASTEIAAAPQEEPTTDTGNTPDASMPAFVPGVIKTDPNFVYPDYDKYPSSFFAGLPPKHDGRDKQSSVKNQGANGLCWAFGTYGVVEANYKMRRGQELDLSESHMGYALSNKNNDGTSNGNEQQGCDRFANGGGNDLVAAAYLMRGTNLSGAVKETDDPYNALSMEDRALSITQSKEKSYQVQNFLFLSGSEKANDAEVATIKSCVMTYGGVGATMDWNSECISPAGGYYSDGTKKYEYGHLVEIVGWDDNYDIGNFWASLSFDGRG